MEIESCIKADRQSHDDDPLGWIPKKADVIELGVQYAEQAFAELGGADPSEVSWTFEPMEGDWQSFEDILGPAAGDEAIRETFADTYADHLQSLVEEAG